MDIANTILQQLGGRRFVAMTGAKHLVAHPEALSFKLPARFARHGVNYVKITLNALDTYDVEYSRVAGLNVTPIANAPGIYADMLAESFSRQTGLATRL